MKIYVFTYAATALLFIGMDAVWLSTMAKLLYRPILGSILLDRLNPAPAFAFYVIYIAGIVFFASVPAFETGRWTTACVRGAILGLIAYATYDLTNMATLKNWSAWITLVDLVWGTIATGTAASLSYIIVKASLRLGMLTTGETHG